MSISLCRSIDIPDPGSKGIEIEVDGITTNLFIVHKDGQYYAYLNRCPHTGVNLDWLPDQFLDMENAFIQCATHDALFDISSGQCIAGPCVDKYLQPVTIAERDGTLFAVTPDESLNEH